MQSNKKAYEGQNIFVGIDVHARQWHVYASPYPGGMRIKPFVMPPDARGLLTHLNDTYPGGTYHSAYEAGFCGFSSHRELVKLGINNIVFNAADIRKTQKDKLRKSDAVDCKVIWENLGKGDLSAIYTPSEQEESDRELIRGRETVVKDMRRAKQRTKMFLHKIGIKGPQELEVASRNWSFSYIDWLSALSASLSGGYSKKLSTLVEDVNKLKSQKKSYDLEILHAVKERHAELYTLLQSVPGIGKLVSAKLCLEIMNFDRFKDPRQLASYIGLVPDWKKSDQTEVVIGTTIRRNSILRTALIEAAWVAIKKEPALGAHFNKCRQNGKAPCVAIVSVARKLVNRIFYVIRTKTKYEVSKD